MPHNKISRPVMSRRTVLIILVIVSVVVLASIAALIILNPASEKIPDTSNLNSYESTSLSPPAESQTETTLSEQAVNSAVLTLSSDKKISVPNGKLNPKSTGSIEGNAAMDSILNNIITPGMLQQEMLKAIYEWVAVEYHNARGLPNEPQNPTPIMGDVIGLSPYKIYSYADDCTNYVYAFTALANRVGFEVSVAEGYFLNNNGTKTEHFWAIVRINGTIYHFDPRAEGYKRTLTTVSQLHYNHFMLNEKEAKKSHETNWATLNDNFDFYARKPEEYTKEYWVNKYNVKTFSLAEFESYIAGIAKKAEDYINVNTGKNKYEDIFNCHYIIVPGVSAQQLDGIAAKYLTASLPYPLNVSTPGLPPKTCVAAPDDARIPLLSKIYEFNNAQYSFTSPEYPDTKYGYIFGIPEVSYGMSNAGSLVCYSFLINCEANRMEYHTGSDPHFTIFDDKIRYIPTNK